MDAIDILPFGEQAYEMWYALLNAGFRILPGAGTDVFTNWRGINNIPGGSREYVEAGPAFSWDRWLARYREGRVFVTNGPLISFQVNGQPMGAEIRVPEGQTVQSRLSAEVTAQMPLDTVEFVENGKVIASAQTDGSTRPVRLEKEVVVDRSSWFAVRAAGKPARGVVGFVPRAHSGSIWVRVGDRPVLVRDDVEMMLRWLERFWNNLEERNNFGPGDNRARARRMLDQALAHYRAKLAEL